MEVSEKARVIAGRYALESLIGEGGMASVWRARDLTLERAVAVKLLFARDERDKQRLVQQFLREARIAASVHHRNVIQIVDFGSTENKQPFMVMELLEGETLGQRMQRRPPLSLSEVVHIASLTLRGLQAVHDAGIIHRDLKPDNVFLTRDPSGTLFPKILDFGISRSAEPRSGRRSALTTREGMIVGTPEYMSPEQARGVRSVDKRADIYGMGCILYEALTGNLPFNNENVGDLIIQIVTSTATPVHEVNPAVPLALSEIVAKAMARSPADRFQDAASMQHALLAVAENSDAIAPLPALSDSPPSPESLGPLPRASLERVRTLEFAFDDEPPAEPTTAPIEVEDRVTAAWPGGRQRRRGRNLLIAAGVACSTAAALFWSQRGAGAGTPDPALAAAAPAPAAEPARELPPRTEVYVKLKNLPAQAIVSVDGVPFGTNPLELPRDGRNRVIKVVAPGKAPWQAVHHASGDATYDVWMVDSPEPAPVKKTAAVAKSAPARPRVHKKPPSALRKLDF